MPVQLGSRGEHGFDQPLGLLSDCHRRIENFLGVLQRVADEVGDGALTEAHRRAVETALEYFRTAAPRHTADEEQSLFPLLRQSDQPVVHAAMQTVEALEREHAAADAAHAEIDSWYTRWIEQGSLPSPQRKRLSAVISALRGLYQRHIEIEDRRIFPLAEQVLSSEQLQRVGRQMAERRGLAVAPR